MYVYQRILPPEQWNHGELPKTGFAGYWKVRKDDAYDASKELGSLLESNLKLQVIFKNNIWFCPEMWGTPLENCQSKSKSLPPELEKMVSSAHFLGPLCKTRRFGTGAGFGLYNCTAFAALFGANQAPELRIQPPFQARTGQYRETPAGTN